MQQKNIIGLSESSKGDAEIQGFNPATGKTIQDRFSVATYEEVDEALAQAHIAWRIFRQVNASDRAAFLRNIALEIESLGESLIERASMETGLPEARILVERRRTCGQLRMFADILEEGSWIQAVIDTAQPDRAPVPKPDLRKYHMAIGPVVVFTASNFPLAYSTAGGDTAAAFAAGCPVIVKAHESHPGTHALVSQAIVRAVRSSNMPDGVFSSLYGKGFEIGQALVQHKYTAAVAFTGSFSGGKALYDLAACRPVPIPVFAEMGSVNPIFLLPDALEGDLTVLSNQLASSVNLGVGQFCTNPGLIICHQSDQLPILLDLMAEAFRKAEPGIMLNKGIHQNYCTLTKHAGHMHGVEIIEAKQIEGDELKAPPTIARVSGSVFLENNNLQKEIFGPYTLVVISESNDQIFQIAENLEGQLTASIIGSASDLGANQKLVRILEEKAGRLIFNGVPTGVEVCYAMHHGGPFPATTDSRFTAVGPMSIRRFIRPVSFQNYPDDQLPDALKNSNPLGILRIVNGNYTKDQL